MQVKLLKMVQNPLDLDQKNYSNVWICSKNAVYFDGSLWACEIAKVNCGLIACFTTVCLAGGGKYEKDGSHPFYCGIAYKKFDSNTLRDKFFSSLDDQIECENLENNDDDDRSSSPAFCGYCSHCYINGKDEQYTLYFRSALRMVASVETLINGGNFKNCWVYNQGCFIVDNGAIVDRRSCSSAIIDDLHCGIALFYYDEYLHFVVVQHKEVKAIFNEKCLDKLDQKEIILEYMYNSDF